MKKLYVFSTLTNSVTYTEYVKRKGNDLPKRGRSVTIQGGAGLTTRHLLTPRGVATEITGEDLSLLESNKVFQRHVANGFLSVSESKPDPDRAVKDHMERDGAAPLTDAEIEAESKRTGTKRAGGKSTK